MGRCVLCDFCDDTGEFSLVQEYENKNYIVRDEQTGDDICNECATSIGTALSEFGHDDCTPDEKLVFGNSWRSEGEGLKYSKRPKEQKGPRQGTKKHIYPAVPAGSYNTANGRIVMEKGEFVIHGSPRWHELVSKEKGSTEAVEVQAIGYAPPPSEGTPAPTSGQQTPSQWLTKPDALAELLETLENDKTKAPTMS